jgi:thiopurine S-methyltransferase
MSETNKLSANYWDKRYLEEKTGWDIGYANSIHVKYVVDNYPNDARILIPGAGSAYEAEHLWKKGFTNVYPCDFAPEVKQRFLKRVKGFPEDNYITGDFFELEEKFDVVLEQTFFCAIDTTLRTKYVKHMKSILNEGGKIFGVLFNMDKLDGPPFGGRPIEYKALFKDSFDILRMEESKESIPERMGNELIIEFLKK